MIDPLLKISERELSSVEFVKDYMQLRFDGPCLTINAPFRLLSSGKTFVKGGPGYRDAICELIGRRVERASQVSKMYLRLEFDDKSVLDISLKPEDQVGPEAVVLDDVDLVIVW